MAKGNYRRNDVTEEQLQKGRETALRRKGFVIFHDYLETLKEMLTAEQIGTIIIALDDYSKTGIETPLNDPVMTMAYKMGMNGIDRDVDKYATTCANRSAAAIAREEERRKNSDDSEDVIKNHGDPPPDPEPANYGESIKDKTLKNALSELDDYCTIHDVLPNYAEAMGLECPTIQLCGRLLDRSHHKLYKALEDLTVEQIYGILKQKNLIGETNTDAIDAALTRMEASLSRIKQ